MLKAYLFHVGISADEIRKEFGHDLKRAYAAAIDRGFQSKQPIDQIVNGMHEPHKSHAFRYMKPGDITLPLIDPLLPILVRWDDEMRETLGYPQSD